MHLFGTAVAAVKKFVPFQNYFALSPSVEHRAEGPFDLTGGYYLSEEEFPNGFADFERFELNTHLYDGEQGVDDLDMPIPTTGALYAGREFKIVTITVNGESLVFETARRGGISYRFKGKVLPADQQEGDLHEGAAGDIAGKLEKLKNGSVVATTETTFYLFGC